MAKKKKTRQTIGKMTNSRMMWGFRPTTRKIEGKSKHLGRREIKQFIKSGRWDD